MSIQTEASGLAVNYTNKIIMRKIDIIYTVLEKLRVQTDDAHFSEELISSMIDQKRALLIKQQYGSKTWHMPIEIKQELCLDLELVDKVNGYSCAGKMLRTSLSLPKSIKIKGKEGPLLVRKPDGFEIALSIVSIERLPYLFNNPSTMMITYCAMDLDNKLVMVSADDKHKFLKSLKVTDIFEEPDVARDLTCDVEIGQEAWDDEYPVEMAMVDPIVNMVVQDLGRSMMMPEDNINDATDNASENGAQLRRR